MKNSKIKINKKYSNRINSKKGRGICNFLCRNIKKEAQEKAKKCNVSKESLVQKPAELQKIIDKLKEEKKGVESEISKLFNIKTVLKKEEYELDRHILPGLRGDLKKNINKLRRINNGVITGGGLFCDKLCKGKKEEFEKLSETCENEKKDLEAEIEKKNEEIENTEYLIKSNKKDIIKYQKEIKGLEEKINKHNKDKKETELDIKEIENKINKINKKSVGGYYRKSNRKSYKKLRRNSRRKSSRKPRRNFCRKFSRKPRRNFRRK